MTSEIGSEMYEFLSQLFPICRSITGNGVRETLKMIQEHIPLKIHEIPTGTQAFDWTIPKEWNIRDAYVMNEKGNRIIDFKENNLHVVGYSIPVNKIVSRAELQEHLHSLPEQPDAIPYVTSYYQERWGFCITHNERIKLQECCYKVFIDSELKDGFLTYGELVIPGNCEREVFLSTYICHPSMANDNLSGPVVATFLAKWIMSRKRRYTYRIIYVPETIGSIAYLSKNLKHMKENVIAGFNLTCVGDDREYSYLSTRKGDLYVDRIALNILKYKGHNFIKYSFLDRGSDERQYDAPGVDLPVCSVMRSKYGTYSEYHTSLDNLELVSSEGLYGAYDIIKECISLIENDYIYKVKCLCEPQLGKRGLYPTLSVKNSTRAVRDMMNFIAYADGENNLVDISNKIGVAVWDLYPIIDKLKSANLLDIVR